jgi:hypothetical protein
MSLANFIEERIREAMEAGEFDNLEGTGKPLDLDAYFNTPEDLRMGYSVLKSAKIVPEEVDRLKEIGELKEKIKSYSNENEKKKLIKILNEKLSPLTFCWKERSAESKSLYFQIRFLMTFNDTYFERYTDIRAIEPKNV